MAGAHEPGPNNIKMADRFAKKGCVKSAELGTENHTSNFGGRGSECGPKGTFVPGFGFRSIAIFEFGGDIHRESSNFVRGDKAIHNVPAWVDLTCLGEGG